LEFTQNGNFLFAPSVLQLAVIDGSERARNQAKILKNVDRKIQRTVYASRDVLILPTTKAEAGIQNAQFGIEEGGKGGKTESMCEELDAWRKRE
jgi:hypothetical protein